MITVVIVDDEKRIVNMLLSLIDWAEEGYQLVGTAHNGPDAFGLIIDKRPDVALIDVRMPGYDGIELIKRVQAANLRTEFIVISGYQYFEYAHNALNLGVSYYLLKPIDEVELKTALHKIAEKCSEQSAQKDDTIKMHNNFLRHLLTNPKIDYDMEAVNEEYLTNFSKGFFKILHLRLFVEEGNDTEVAPLLEKFIQILQQKIGSFCVEHIETILDRDIIQLINFQCNESEMQQAIRSAYYDIRDTCDVYEKFTARIGLGSTVDSISRIDEALETAKEALIQGLTVKEGVIVYGAFRFRDYPVRQIYTIELEEKLLGEVSLGNEFGIRKTMNIILDRIKSCQDINPARLYDVVFSIENAVERQFEMHRDLEQDMLPILRDGFYRQINNAESLDTLFSFTVDYVLNISRRVHQDKVVELQRPVRLAKKYIETHFSSGVTLDELANEVGLNSAYLSTLFKKELGIGVSEYVIACRVEAAKQLLAETRESIECIAEQVGYNDVKHFSKQFKKITQMKPSEYRKLFS